MPLPLFLYLAFVIWVLFAMFSIFHLLDVKNGRIATGEKDRYGFDRYYPAEDVPPVKFVVAALWPVTLTLLAPLGAYLVVKKVVIGLCQFFVFIGKTYKTNF